MASKCISIGLYLANSLLLIAIVTGCEIATNHTPKSNVNSYPKPNMDHYSKPNPNGNYNPNPNSYPTSTPYPTPTPTPKFTPNSIPTPTPNYNANPNQNPSTYINPTSATCPRDTLRLGVCASLLGGLVSLEVGSPPVKPCCSLIQGLVDLEAAVCLCTAIKANVLGINLNVPLSLSLLLNACGNQVPSGYQCA
ncbi:hypothetical protein LXL04_005472 [Taraxacum kok-saghyz]